MNMKFFSAMTLCGTLLTASVLADPSPASVAGQIDFGPISAPAEGQFVEVNIRSNLISMAARLTEKSEPEVAKLLRGLQAIRVNVVALNDENREELKERITALRTKLTEQGWERIVAVKERKDDVGVFIKLRGEDAIEGVVVTVIHGDKEVVFVNVVGDIRPEQIAKVGESLNIEPLKKLSRELNGAK